jgi:hypothetical protein
MRTPRPEGLETRLPRLLKQQKSARRSGVRRKEHARNEYAKPATTAHGGAGRGRHGGARSVRDREGPRGTAGGRTIRAGSGHLTALEDPRPPGAGSTDGGTACAPHPRPGGRRTLPSPPVHGPAYWHGRGVLREVHRPHLQTAPAVSGTRRGLDRMVDVVGGWSGRHRPWAGLLRRLWRAGAWRGA